MKHEDSLDAEGRLRNEFNRWAGAGRGEGMAEEHANIAEGMLARMSFEERDKILDIGCGAGWLVARLGREVPGGQVVGIDLADEMIVRARRQYADVTNVMFQFAAAEEIPWDECFFNKVVSIESAYYWPEPERAFREIFRVLQPGGTAWILMNLYAENEYSHQWREKLDVETRLLSGDEWCDLLRETGFVEAGHSRVPDTRPVSDAHESEWFRDAEELRRFREVGALLVSGIRPELK